MPDNNIIPNNDQANLDYVIQRLRNSANAAEGPTLPPRQIGDLRVPRVQGLRVLQAKVGRGGVIFTIAWQDIGPTVTCYLVTPSIQTTAGSTYYLPVTVTGSPANVIVPCSGGTTVTFTVQAMLAGGTATPMADAAVCAGRAPYPVWLNATLQSSWTNVGSGWPPASYMLDYDGFVHVRGLVTGGTMTSGDNIFTLPPQLYPKFHQMIPVPGNTTNAQYIHVLTNGEVEVGQVSANGFLGLYFEFSLE